MMSIIKEKGVSYCSNNDLYTVLFGKAADKYKSEIVNLLSTNKEAVLSSNLPESIKIKMVAFMELADRQYSKDQIKITGSEDVAEILHYLKYEKQEHFVVITLDGANRVIKTRTVSIGTINQSLVHPREVFAPALEDRAASIILVHNHPSGNKDESREDILVTERLVETSKILGIEVLDHIIITKSGHKSFKANHLM